MVFNIGQSLVKGYRGADTMVSATITNAQSLSTNVSPTQEGLIHGTVENHDTYLILIQQYACWAVKLLELVDHASEAELAGHGHPVLVRFDLIQEGG